MTRCAHQANALIDDDLDRDLFKHWLHAALAGKGRKKRPLREFTQNSRSDSAAQEDPACSHEFERQIARFCAVETGKKIECAAANCGSPLQPMVSDDGSGISCLGQLVGKPGRLLLCPGVAQEI